MLPMPSRQSDPGPGVSGDVKKARRRFAVALNKRVRELAGPNVDEKELVRWLADKVGVRWQTSQFWLEGESFPLGHNLQRLSEAIGMDARELLGPMSDDIDPKWPTWRTFLGTPEGASLTDDERWHLRLFGWPKPPTVGDYRALLALLRQNAER